MPLLRRLGACVSLGYMLLAAPVSAQRVAPAAVVTTHELLATPRAAFDTAAPRAPMGRRLAWTSLGALTGLVIAGRAVGEYRNSQLDGCSFCARSYRNEAYFVFGGAGALLGGGLTWWLTGRADGPHRDPELPETVAPCVSPYPPPAAGSVRIDGPGAFGPHANDSLIVRVDDRERWRGILRSCVRAAPGLSIAFEQWQPAGDTLEVTAFDLLPRDQPPRTWILQIATRRKTQG